MPDPQTLAVILQELSRTAERLLVWAAAGYDLPADTKEYLRQEAVVVAACVNLLRSTEEPSPTTAAFDKLMAQTSKTIN